MKKSHDEYESATEEERQTMSYRYRNAHNEWKEMRETLKESNKVCAYCNKTGHRVLTCPTRLNNVDSLREINKWWKPAVQKTLREVGFGLGSLIELDVWVTIDNEHQRRSVPHLVIGVEEHLFDFTSLREGFGSIQVMNTITMRRINSAVPPIVLQKLMTDNLSVEGLDWVKDPWNCEESTNPFQRLLRSRRLPKREVEPILGASDKPFSGELFFPLEKKKDINKMFREVKKKGDEGRFYTEEYTGTWITEMYDLLIKHGVIK
jgi:hypothetical protein